MIRSTWAMPGLIGATSLVGLVSALTGDGVRDAVAWLLLAIPILTVVWAIRRTSR